jgi:creatinine amidohydrolase
MLLEALNWMDVEKYLEKDQRVVLTLGATEQHGALSLLTDALVPWEIAKNACSQEKVIMAPLLSYGFSHWAMDYPGTISLKASTYTHVIFDIMQSLLRSGFRRILLLNGHSGNRGAREAATEAITDIPNARVWFYSWYELPVTAAYIRANGDMAHANWSENFPFTRLSNTPPIVSLNKDHNYRRSASAWREDFPLGSMDGNLQAPDETMLKLLNNAVAEVVGLLRDMLL